MPSGIELLRYSTILLQTGWTYKKLEASQFIQKQREPNERAVGQVG
jgi:hypothetical protein